MNDLPLAVRDDRRRIAARGNHSAGAPELLLDAGCYAVNRGCSAVDDAAFHAVNGVLSDDCFRRLETDHRQLRGSARERIERYAHAGNNHAAAEGSGFIDDGKRRRRTHIHGDDGKRIFMRCRDRIRHAVTAERRRIVHLNFQSGFYTGADNHRLSPDCPQDGFPHRLRHGRNDRRNDAAIKIRILHMI